MPDQRYGRGITHDTAPTSHVDRMTATLAAMHAEIARLRRSARNATGASQHHRRARLCQERDAWVVAATMVEQSLAHHHLTSR